MKKNEISPDEFAQFKSIAFDKKVKSMVLYLIGMGGQKYNMQEVGAAIFGDENYSYTVSMIHRCYNFSGQNGGKYRNGCSFEKKYGYRVTAEDIEAFVREYPNGTFRNGVTFEDFLLSRLNNASDMAYDNYSQPEYVQMHRTQLQGRQSQSIYGRYYGRRGHQLMTGHRYKKSAVIGCIVGVLILILMIISGSLFRYWIIALIVLVLTIVAFINRKW